MIFFVVACDPRKNIDTFYVIVAGFALVILFNVGIIWKIDFGALGSVEKKFQTVVETILAFVTLMAFWVLRPRVKKK